MQGSFAEIQALFAEIEALLRNSKLFCVDLVLFRKCRALLRGFGSELELGCADAA